MPCHDDEAVPREEFGTAHHHEDQANAERRAGQDADGAPGGRPGPGQCRGGENPAERDERPREKRQRERGDAIHPALPHTHGFGSVRHFGRQEGVEL
jgi:hypothetical protein